MTPFILKAILSVVVISLGAALVVWNRSKQRSADNHSETESN